MYVIARQLWSQAFPEGGAAGRRRRRPARRRFAGCSTQYSKEHGKAEDLVKRRGATAAKIKAFIKAKDIPAAARARPLQDHRDAGVPARQLDRLPEPGPAAGCRRRRAITPSARRRGTGTPAASTSYMEEYNRHMLQILTIHEAYPGHYVQLEYANRHPSLIRKVLSSGVFAEGWAVYTEQMMLDQGYGDGDLALRLISSSGICAPVCNAILDYKMHCTEHDRRGGTGASWSCARFQSEAEAILKIIRAKQSSCQLSTYFVGRMAFHGCAAACKTSWASGSSWAISRGCWIMARCR